MQPRIRLLMGPGTLPSRGADRMDLAKYRKSGKSQMTGAELLAELPEVAAVASVQAEAAQHGIATTEDLRRLARRLSEVLSAEVCDGAVFVQGTNSIEETAYFLNLTVKTSKPLVITGAQRPFTALSSDAPLNLYDAIRVAAHPASKGKGVVVVTNGEINAARDVTKTNTYHLQTFRSRDLGLIGYADADAVVYYREPVRRHTAASEFDILSIGSLPRVDILYVGIATQPGLAKAAVSLGAKGIVAAGTGAGSLGNLEAELAAIAASGQAVVVRSSRTGEGRVVREDNWQHPGMVAADSLSPQKAALLLGLALTKTKDADGIQRLFDTY